MFQLHMLDLIYYLAPPEKLNILSQVIHPKSDLGIYPECGWALSTTKSANSIDRPWNLSAEVGTILKYPV